MGELDVTRPRRGRPRRVDRSRILEAAKVLDPETLTMQALAEQIGVDRKTLHYHVQDRASLLRMVAADAFRDAVAASNFTPQDDWREAIRSFAHITRQAVIAAGAWASYVGFDGEDDLQAVRPAEAAAQALVGAGLPEAQAGRLIAMLAVLAFASARDEAVSPSARHPQEPVLQKALDRAPEQQFTLVRRLLGTTGASLGSQEQFTFEVDLIVLGVERILETS
jgi:TetR/AcrR family transcriptional regulator, tetracycline repressor protein